MSSAALIHLPGLLEEYHAHPSVVHGWGFLNSVSVTWLSQLRSLMENRVGVWPFDVQSNNCERFHKLCWIFISCKKCYADMVHENFG